VRPSDPGLESSDADGYDPVAATYARFALRYSPPLARRMVTLAGVAPSDRVLDVGTGTGIVALEAARAVGPEGAVLGVDLSEGMLAVARAGASMAGLKRVEFQRMDAERLEIPDGAFDVAVSLFAVLHLHRPLVALSEMRRVLRPGGRLVVAVGSGPPPFSWAAFTHGIARLPGLLRQGRGMRLTAPRFLEGLIERCLGASPESPEAAPARHGSGPDVRRMVAEAGFSSVRCEWEGHEATLENPDEFWELQRTFSSVARRRLQATPPETVEAIRAEFRETCERVQAGGGELVYPYAAFFVIARSAER
jgi:ubiquinone/menaquinone biosynthesis C-methylase UbiE